jgi:DNA-binding transcriptional regulator YiaG
MTPADLRAWRAAMFLTQQQAAEALGVSLRTVKSWEAGFAAPPAFLALACAALAAGLGPWVDQWSSS